MADSLEYPGPEGSPDWGLLYLYRADEVVEARPIFTGDVFFDVEVQGVGAVETKHVLVLQHPCALRTNGVDLADSLMVVEVIPGKLYSQSEWLGNYRVMPLPELVAGNDGNFVGAFTSPYLVIPDSLDPKRRVACMSPFGVNLLLQRWVYHNSRAAVLSTKFDAATSAQYEEADAIEEWCETRHKRSVSVPDATLEATAWLNDTGGSGVPRRQMLENPQWRSNIRKEMRRYARQLNESS